MNINNKKEKLVPELRFREFKEEWKQLHLKDIANLKSGGTPSTKIPSYWQGNIPWVSSADISEDDINNIKISRYISEEAIKHSATHLIPAESILVVSRVGVGKMAINNVPITTSQDFQSVILNKPTTDIHFLVYPLKAQVKKSLGHNQGTSIRGILKEDLENISINLPTLPEQQKLSSFLSLIDKRIELLNKKKELLEIYKKGIMHNIFNRDIRFKDINGKDYPEWEEKRLGEILTERNEYAENVGTYEHLSLSKNGVTPKTEQYNREFLVKGLNKKYKITKLEDICYNPANLKFGVICKNSYGLGIFSPIYITYEVQRQDKDFIGILLTQKSFINKARRYEEGTVYERQAVNPSDFVKVKILIPEIPEQNKISRLYKILNKSLVNISFSLDYNLKFKQALLQKMFI